MADLRAIHAAYRRLACAILVGWLGDYYRLRVQFTKATDRAMRKSIKAKKAEVAKALLADTAAHRMADIGTDKLQRALQQIDKGKLNPRNLTVVMGGRR